MLWDIWVNFMLWDIWVNFMLWDIWVNYIFVVYLGKLYIGGIFG